MPDNEYPYFCEPHLVFGMTGTVIVEVPPENVPAASAWGIAVMVLMIVAAGSIVIRRVRATGGPARVE